MTHLVADNLLFCSVHILFMYGLYNVYTHPSACYQTLPLLQHSSCAVNYHNMDGDDSDASWKGRWWRHTDNPLFSELSSMETRVLPTWMLVIIWCTSAWAVLVPRLGTNTRACVYKACLVKTIYQMFRFSPSKTLPRPRFKLKQAENHLGPLLLTWFNFNPCMDK